MAADLGSAGQQRIGATVAGEEGRPTGRAATATGRLAYAMPINTADVALLDLPLVEPFAASHGTTTARAIVIVRVEVDGQVGWGECSALPAATYTPESAAGSFALLADHLLPALVGARKESPTATLDALRPLHPRAPFALAAAEMALLDAELTAAGTSLARWLGATRERVPAGVSIGLDRPDAVVATARRLAADGYRRLKIKIQPGHDHDLLRRLTADPDLSASGAELHLDANGAFGPGHLDLLVDLARGGADTLEQPLAPDHIDASAELVGRLAALAATDGAARPVPLVVDEGVASRADALELADRGAITGISIKPGRVGGLTVARELHHLAVDRGLSATAGGMLETGLGRHALAALAALPGFDLTGDLSPAGRWLSVDPWPDLVMADGWIAVPAGPGVAPAPDPDVLARHTVERRRIEPTTTSAVGR